MQQGALVIVDEETGRNVLADDGSLESALAFKLAAAAPALRDALGHLLTRFEHFVGMTGCARADERLMMACWAAIVDTQPTLAEAEALTVARDRQLQLPLTA